jgi:AraC-like DNA-binding protein
MPSSRALLSAVIAQTFDDLEVSVALWLRDSMWQAIHIEEPNLAGLEIELGVDVPRNRYNARCLARAVRGRRPVKGELRGFCDLFVPVAGGVLVTGPFARARPSAAEIRVRWLEMTGSQGRLTDPAFERYVSLTLSALTLEGSLLASFERLMKCFGMLVSGEGDPDALGAEAQKHRQELVAARLVKWMWGTTRRAVDEHGMEGAGYVEPGHLAPLGVDRIPQGVVVGLLAGGRAEPDLLDERVRTDAFLRACVALARKRGGVLAGPVGRNGVVLLTDSATPRARSAVADLTNRVAAIARRLGFELHAGVADEKVEGSLPARYLAALRAAEKAQSERRGVVRGEPARRPTSARLRRLRSDLGRCAMQGPLVISARFEEYIQAVLSHGGHRFDSVRANLDAGLERLLEPVQSEGLLDEKSVSELWESIERAADAARTVSALSDSYRSIVKDLGHGLQSPTGARRERSLRRALSFIREHLCEPLPLDRVARAAGFAPKYFSHLFHQSEGTSYATYLRDQRLARAKELLKRSRLSVDRIARSCGFRTRTHFHSVFRETVGVTPIAYRTAESR